MAAANPNNAREEILIDEEPFRGNAFRIIMEVLELSVDRPHLFKFVDEVLHSIFFLGDINSPKYSPEDILNDSDMVEGLRELYPRPFELYASQVPQRSPFSGVLDMIVQVTGEQNEELIRYRLRNIIHRVDPSFSRKLVSSTICVSQSLNSDSLTKHYGVSMSTKRRKILIGASCLSTWHVCVAEAVMTYFPHMTKKPYFDGTFTLTPQVRCKAFDIRLNIEKPPCTSCANLFGLIRENETVQQYSYGNCAEAESLSNLFKNERVSGLINTNPDRIRGTREQRKAKSSVEAALISFLPVAFITPQITFYTP